MENSIIEDIKHEACSRILDGFCWMKGMYNERDLRFVLLQCLGLDIEKVVEMYTDKYRKYEK